MSKQQMANYTLSIQADSGYEATTEGRCTAKQYGQAMDALHGTFPPQRKPLTDEEIAELLSKSAGIDMKMNGGDLLFARAIEAAHGINKG